MGRFADQLQQRLRGLKVVDAKSRTLKLAPAMGTAGAKTETARAAAPTESTTSAASEGKHAPLSAPKRTRSSYRQSGLTPVIKRKYGGGVEDCIVLEVPLQPCVSASAAAIVTADVDDIGLPAPSPPRVLSPMQPPAKKQKTRKSRKHVASFAEDNIPEDTIFKTPVSPPHPQPSATRRHAPAAAEPQLMDSFDTSHNMPAKMKRRTKEASPTDQAGPQPATASQAPDPASSLNISSSELKDKKEVPKTRRGRTKKSEKPCCEEKDNIAVVKEEPRIEILPDYKHPSNRYHRTISLTCGEFAVTGMDTEAFCKRIQRALEMVTAEGYGIRGLKQHVLDAIFKE